MIGPLRIVVLLFGGFLVVDALFLHAINFSYVKLSLGWLDPYLSHAYWGVILIIGGLTFPAGAKPLK